MEFELDRTKIDEALPKVAPGLAKYLRIMESGLPHSTSIFPDDIVGSE